jgi:hypothetical protein
MTTPPDALLFVGVDSGVEFDAESICGVPVFHSAFVADSVGDGYGAPFIPLWLKAGDHIIDRSVFSRASAEAAV